MEQNWTEPELGGTGRQKIRGGSYQPGRRSRIGGKGCVLWKPYQGKDALRHLMPGLGQPLRANWIGSLGKPGEGSERGWEVGTRVWMNLDKGRSK